MNYALVRIRTLVSGMAFVLVVFSPPASAWAEDSKEALLTFPIHVAIALEGGKPVCTDAWVSQQLSDANELFEKTHVRFRVTKKREIAPGFAALHTRADRDALAHLSNENVIDVFVVAALEDVDEPGRYRKGVAWTSRREAKRFLILSAIAPPTVLAHELGHFFGNGHSDVADNLMSYARTGGRVFLDDIQVVKVNGFAAQFIALKRLIELR